MPRDRAHARVSTIVDTRLGDDLETEQARADAAHAHEDRVREYTGAAAPRARATDGAPPAHFHRTGADRRT